MYRFTTNLEPSEPWSRRRPLPTTPATPLGANGSSSGTFWVVLILGAAAAVIWYSQREKPDPYKGTPYEGLPKPRKLTGQAKIDDDAARAQYEAEVKKYGGEEQRRVAYLKKETKKLRRSGMSKKRARELLNAPQYTFEEDLEEFGSVPITVALREMDEAGRARAREILAMED